MARKQILVSDISGEAISDGFAQVRISISSKPNSTFLVDASEKEVATLLASAREVKKRGRKPKKS